MHLFTCLFSREYLSIIVAILEVSNMNQAGFEPTKIRLPLPTEY